MNRGALGRTQLHCALAGDSGRMTLVGLGAVATVWRIEDASSPDEVLGLKLLRGSMRRRPSVGESMAREYAFLREIDHPGVPRAYALSQWHGRHALVFHYIDGRPLLDILAEGALSPAATLQHALALFDILRYIHARRPAIVHSDLSPENLLVDRAGQLHLIDFGAAITGGEQRASPGKPSYMSPEQAQGRAWNERSDLYQAGIVLFEMLTGQRYNPGATSLARRAFAANPVIDIDSQIDVPFRAVIRRLLDPDPAMRWPSAAACLGALKRLRPTREGDNVAPPERQAPT